MLFDSTVRKELARSFGATLMVLLTIVLTNFLIRTLGLAANGAVLKTGRERISGRGGGQRLKAHAGQQTGGANVPGVGDDEGSIPLVQRAEACAFFCLRGHDDQCRGVAAFSATRDVLVVPQSC